MTTVTSITGFYGHIYSSKSAAARAAKNAAGQRVDASHPMFSHFDALVTLTPEMLSVTRLQGGWSYCWKYTPADVRVATLGTDGKLHRVPFLEVAHWPKDWDMLGYRYQDGEEWLITPRGKFRFGFNTREEAEAAEYALWFSHNGVEIYGHRDTGSRAIRESLADRRSRLLAA